jgi:hypothetical protein
LISRYIKIGQLENEPLFVFVGTNTIYFICLDSTQANPAVVYFPQNFLIIRGTNTTPHAEQTVSLEINNKNAETESSLTLNQASLSTINITFHFGIQSQISKIATLNFCLHLTTIASSDPL